ncbi:MAG: hypothetical protein GDA36_08045 [Rhodobacteraceae bacterium]|nr:hypothetical protein [Paracoccaceae bacterium]
MVYVGYGVQTSDEDLRDFARNSEDNAYSVGAYFRIHENWLLGFDIGSEGSKPTVTSTGSDIYIDDVDSAISFNALIGTNLVKEKIFMLDTSLLLGARQEHVCVATPRFRGCGRVPGDDGWGFNYGILVTGVIRNVAVVGVRATGESIQGVVGFAF